MRQVFIGDQLRVHDKKGNIFEGEAIYVESAEFSDSGENEIVIEKNIGGFKVLTESNISSIEYLD